MKATISLKNLCSILFILFISTALKAQDTLHLDFGNTQVVPDKPMEDKIVAWGKTLNGKKQDVMIVAYYHKGEFKKFAEQRVDEMFLSLNRKVRNLINIKSQEAKKGEDYQRTRVDVIYYPEGQDPKSMAEKKKAEEKAAKEAEKKKKEEEEKAAKADKDKNKKDDKKDGKSDVTKKDDKSADDKGKKDSGEKDDKKKGGKEESDVEEEYGYVNKMDINEGGSAKLEEVKYMQRAKLIVAQAGIRPDVDENLLKAAKDFWTLNSNITSMPYKDALKMGKENKKDTMIILSFVLIRQWVEQKSFGYSYKVLKIGYAVAIENGKGHCLFKQFIPVDKSKGGATLEYFAFGVSALNSMFTTMLEKNIDKSTKVIDVLKENLSEVKEKPVVIPETLMHPKLPREDISKYFPSGKVEVVSYDEWKNDILNRKDVLYVMIAPIPGFTKQYHHYIMNAKTGRIDLIDQGPKFQMSMGVGVNKSLDPSQSGYVDKANFQRYEKAVTTGGQDSGDEKDSKDKSKEEKKEKEKKK